LAESVYKIIELVGTSTESWEKAAAAAVERASGTLRDLRIAEVDQLDMHVEGGKAVLTAKIGPPPVRGGGLARLPRSGWGRTVEG
jgi:flavin-binding protein dodecin